MTLFVLFVALCSALTFLAFVFSCLAAFFSWQIVGALVFFGFVSFLIEEIRD